MNVILALAYVFLYITCNFGIVSIFCIVLLCWRNKVDIKAEMFLRQTVILIEIVKLKQSRLKTEPNQN